MSAKSASKRMVNRVRNVTRTPIKTGSNSQPLKMCSQTSVTTISFEEHKKVLTRNNTLARESASLREQIRLLKNEIMALKASQVHQELPDSYQMFETFAVALNYLSEEYNCIRNKFDDLGMNVENVRRVLSDCSTQLHQSYPEFTVRCFQNNGESNGIWDENNGTTHDCRGMDANHSRHSLSSHERESRRRLSLERIKRDFHVFSELSTILEQSREHGSTSVNFGRESMRRMSGKSNERASQAFNPLKSGLNCRTSDVPPISEVDSDAENDHQEGGHEPNIAHNLECNQLKSQKLPLRDSTNTQIMSRSNDSVSNASHVYDIHDKENVMPSVIPPNASRFSLNIFNLAHSQHSSPVENTNGVNQPNDVANRATTIINFTLNDDFNDKTTRNSSATVLVEETHDYRNSLMGKRFTGNSMGVMETPQLTLQNEMTEKIRSDDEVFEVETNPIIDNVQLEVSHLATNSSPSNKTNGVTKTKAKRPRRNSIRIISYVETSDPENATETDVVVKKRPKRKTAKTSQSESQKSVVTKSTKTKSQPTEQTQQTQAKKRKREKPKETPDNLERRLSVYEFQDEDNGNCIAPKVLAKSKRTKTKK